MTARGNEAQWSGTLSLTNSVVHSHSKMQWDMFVFHSKSTFAAQVSVFTLIEVRPQIPNSFMGYLILIEPLWLYKHLLSLWVNNLIHFYWCCQKIIDVRKVFNEKSKKTVVSWNSIMTVCVERLSLDDRIEYFF